MILMVKKLLVLYEKELQGTRQNEFRIEKIINPHMYEIFLQRYCMKWVPGDPLKEMIN